LIKARVHFCPDEWSKIRSIAFSFRINMNFQNLINSRFGVGGALLLGQLTPRIIGYPVAKSIAGWFSNSKSSVLVKAMRVNQGVAHRGTLSPEQLDDLVASVFANSGRALYDLYHNLHSPRIINKMVDYSEDFSHMLDRYHESGKGAIIVAPHLGSFDIGGLALAIRKVPFQTLSYPNPGDGYQLQNYIREKYGLYITPMSVSSMREAEQRLKDAGLVLTGLDRPLPGSKYKPMFFGRPTELPVSYIAMALKNHVPVVVVCCYSDGKRYVLDASEMIDMIPHPDRQEEIERNAERVLVEAEKMILAHPEQWFMYYPLWPELIESIY
jgi:lauroyl/myristoyl acyltransferase